MKVFVHQYIHFNSMIINKYPHMLIPEVTICIQVGSELHVTHFYKGCSVPILQWFRQGQDCRLSRKSMLQNFRIYLESYIENIYPIFDELQKHMFTKKSVSSD